MSRIPHIVEYSAFVIGMFNKNLILTSGCSFTGTYTFSWSVVTVPSASGKTNGSFLTPFIWNKLALTFAISETKQKNTFKNGK